MSDDLFPFKSKQPELTLEGGCLLWSVWVVVPPKLCPRLLQELHLNHPGMSRMKSITRKYVWWPGLELAKSCLSCQPFKTTPLIAPLQSMGMPTKPWQRVYINFAGPFLGRTFLHAVVTHYKWPEVIEMPSNSKGKTISDLKHMFSTHSCYNKWSLTMDPSVGQMSLQISWEGVG